MIYQTPWRRDGKIAGLVEISMIIPDTLPHYTKRHEGVACTACPASFGSEKSNIRLMRKPSSPGLSLMLSGFVPTAPLLEGFVSPA